MESSKDGPFLSGDEKKIADAVAEWFLPKLPPVSYYSPDFKNLLADRTQIRTYTRWREGRLQLTKKGQQLSFPELIPLACKWHQLATLVMDKEIKMILAPTPMRLSCLDQEVETIKETLYHLNQFFVAKRMVIASSLSSEVLRDYFLKHDGPSLKRQPLLGRYPFVGKLFLKLEEMNRRRMLAGLIRETGGELAAELLLQEANHYVESPTV